jgi:hypothetical protein
MDKVRENARRAADMLAIHGQLAGWAWHTRTGVLRAATAGVHAAVWPARELVRESSGLAFRGLDKCRLSVNGDAAARSANAHPVQPASGPGHGAGDKVRSGLDGARPVVVWRLMSVLARPGAWFSW